MRVCDIRYLSLADFIRFAVRRNAATWLSIATVIIHDVDLHTLTTIIIIRYNVLITTEYRLTDRIIIIWTTYDNCRLQDDHGAVSLSLSLGFGA